MAIIKKIKFQNYTLYSSEQIEIEDINHLIREIKNTPVTIKKGRIGIKLLNYKGKKIACRQYVHGGIFRAITKDKFLSAKRAKHEMEILFYLKSLNIPAVRPFCVIEERRCFFKRLYLLTFFEEKTKNLLEYLISKDRKNRLKVLKKAAYLFHLLKKAGVYHRDLHLDNILVKTKNIHLSHNNIENLIFIDFDKAEMKKITERHMEKMFWRLNRYAEKLERKSILKIDDVEKLLFLRSYERLSKKPMIKSMVKKYPFKKFISRIGWAFDSFFYRF